MGNQAQMNQQDNPLWRFSRRLQLHSDLGSGDVQAVLSLPATPITRRQSAYIVREGDLVQNCAILVSGCAVRHRTTGDGNRQIVAVYLPGDPLDLDHFYLPLADDDIQVARVDDVQKFAEVALVRHEDLRELIESRPAVARAMIMTLLVDTSAFREWVLNVGQRDATTKIAHILCEIALRMEVLGLTFDGSILPLNQIHIAEATGLTPVHVNRTLKQMQKDGLIERKEQLVQFPDWRRLRIAGDFDPHYLHIQGLEQG